MRVCVLGLLAACLTVQSLGQVMEIRGYPLVPLSIVNDGDGGALLLGTIRDKMVLSRFDDGAELVWSRIFDSDGGKSLVRMGNGMVLVTRGTSSVGGLEQAGVWASAIEKTGKEGPRHFYSNSLGIAFEAASGSNRHVVLGVVSDEKYSIVTLDENLSAVRQFGFRRTFTRHLHAVAALPDGGAVFAGADGGACFVGRIDARSRLLWANRYSTGRESYCTRAVVSGRNIFVDGIVDFSDTVVMSLELDGTVRYAFTAQGENFPSLLAATDNGVLTGTQKNDPEYTNLTLFGRDGPDPKLSAKLRRTYRVLPGGLAAVEEKRKIKLFAAIDEFRALYASSEPSDLTTQCDRFGKVAPNWKSIEPKVLKLALDPDGIEIMQTVAPPLAYEDLTIRVRACRAR